MNTAELISALAIDAAKLQEWLAAGLPHRRVGRGRRFDAETVQKWLIAHGHVKAPRFVGTMDEAAGAVGIHPRTLATWIRQGAPGKTSEGYDLDALATWRNERYADHDPLLSGPTSPALERYRLARAQREELALARELREVLSIAEIDKVWDTLASSHLRACASIQRMNLAGAEAVQQIREAFEVGRADLAAVLGGDSDKTLTRLDDTTNKPQEETHANVTDN